MGKVFGNLKRNFDFLSIEQVIKAFYSFSALIFIYIQIIFALFQSTVFFQSAPWDSNSLFLFVDYTETNHSNIIEENFITSAHLYRNLLFECSFVPIIAIVICVAAHFARSRQRDTVLFACFTVLFLIWTINCLSGFLLSYVAVHIKVYTLAVMRTLMVEYERSCLELEALLFCNGVRHEHSGALKYCEGRKYDAKKTSCSDKLSDAVISQQFPILTAVVSLVIAFWFAVMYVNVCRKVKNKKRSAPKLNFSKVENVIEMENIIQPTETLVQPAASYR
uniref:Uncharacterized protein n=1 Tax=Plectus sambesii TaxID=2011161 RepID=A0A914XN51_9BILA